MMARASSSRPTAAATVVAATDDGNEAVARHATRYCLSRYRPACAKLLGLRNALGDHAPFVAKRLMERAAPHARRGPRMARWRPEDGCWRADGGHASCEGDAFGASALLKYVHDAPAEDEFDSYTRVASDKLLRPASSSLAACVCQGTEVDLPLVEALPTPSPESNDGPSLDPRQLLAILGGDGAYFADVLCDVECGAGFTLTRLGDRVEARLHPGASFNAEAAVHADALIVLRGRDCTLRRRGADDVDRTLVDALAATEMRALAARLLPRVDAGAAVALLQSCGRRLQRFAAQHHFLQPLAPPSSRNRLDARVKARDQRGAVSLTLFEDGRGRALDVQREPAVVVEASADGKELQILRGGDAYGAPGQRPPRDLVELVEDLRDFQRMQALDPDAQAALLAQRARGKRDAAAAAASSRRFAVRVRGPAAPAPAKRSVDGRVAAALAATGAFLRRLRGGEKSVMRKAAPGHGPTSRARAAPLAERRARMLVAKATTVTSEGSLACSRCVQPSAAVPSSEISRHSAGAWLYAHCARSKSAGRKSTGA